MPITDEIIVKIGSDFEELKTDLKKISSDIDDFGKKAQSTGRKFDASFKVAKVGATAAATAIAGVTTALGALALKQAEASQETARWADRLAISRAEFAKFAAIGARFGATTDDVGDSIKDLNERIADAASGNKTYEEALNRIGLASKDLINIPIEEQFIRVADAIGKLNNAGDQNFVTAELMADAGFRLLPVFRQGEDAIRAMGEEVVKTGEALNSFQLERLEKVNQNMIKIGASATILGNAVLDYLAPGFEEAAKFLGVFAEATRDLLGQSDDSLKRQLEEVNAEIAKLPSQNEFTTDFLAGADIQGSARKRIQVANERKRQEEELIELLQRKLEIERRLNSIDEEPISSGGSTPTPQTPSISSTGGATDAAAIGAQAAADLKAQLALKEIVDRQTADAQLLEQQRIAGEAAAELETQLALEKAQRESLAIGERLLKEEEAAQQLADMKQRYLDREFKAEDEQAQRLKWLWESGAQGRLKNAQKLFGQLSGLMNSENRKAFEIGKAASIAQATIDTYQAANANYKWGAAIGGPAVGGAFAGIAIAAGLANVQNIASTQFGSRGGGGASNGGGGIGGGGGDEAQPVTQVLESNVTFTGDSISQDQFRAFASGLNSAIEDGVTIGTINA